MTPLEGLLVLDFTTLLPGPLATLWMREAGARVIKIERPPIGDEMREYEPRFGSTSVNFALLNAGKESLALDLKNEADWARLEPLLHEADVLVEQFRPGVMARLGLDYESLKSINPSLVYCSITGYGQSGPKAHVAAHDLNYIADTGLLSLVEPALPPVLVADIGGGSYPAFTNVLLALMQRERTGQGTWLDISMTDNLFPWIYWAIGSGVHAGDWPRPSGNLVTGGSPRYNVYETADSRFLAVGALEDRFWIPLCSLLDLDAGSLDDIGDPEGVRSQIAERIASQSSQHWQELFDGHDVCCNLVRTVQEALDDPHFKERGLFDRALTLDDERMPALPSPIAQALRDPAPLVSPPELRP
jgi:crotonobetainyl-CoA:carnitine CoA-transferase CaiB-like acyl-CoA transferase